VRLIDDLLRLNSITKYPSISTYHALGEKGKLTEEHLEAPEGDLLYTEKVDGTNARIILVPGEAAIIGSREELLHAIGDLIHNPSQGIVPRLQRIASEAFDRHSPPGRLLVLFGEVYGGNIGRAAKQYTTQKSVGFRVFDLIDMDMADARALMSETRESISLWRENGGQSFADEERIQQFAEQLNLEVAPRIELPDGHARLPESNMTGVNWLKGLVPETKVALQSEAGQESEGIVVRAADRSFIAKIRYEDYQRTLKGLKR
jgi:hypothetical protein